MVEDQDLGLSCRIKEDARGGFIAASLDDVLKVGRGQTRDANCVSRPDRSPIPDREFLIFPL